MTRHAGLFDVDVPPPTQAGLYRTIVSDPPWKEQGGGKIKRGADRHYPLMKTQQIMALPVDQWAAMDAHLYLWVTNSFLRDGFRVMDAWGFRYVTKIDWFKVDVDDEEEPTEQDLQMGIGQYFRGATESCLFGVRGRCEYRFEASGKRAQGLTAILAKRTTIHSEKPPHLRLMAERVSHGPRLEMFARDAAEGWDAWGLETPQMEALREMAKAA